MPNVVTYPGTHQNAIVADRSRMLDFSFGLLKAIVDAVTARTSWQLLELEDAADEPTSPQTA